MSIRILTSIKARAVTAGLLVVCGEVVVAANAGGAHTTAAAAVSPTSSRRVLLKILQQLLGSNVRGTANAAAEQMYTISSHMQSAGIASRGGKDLSTVAGS
jgi:hypothetical protein